MHMTLLTTLSWVTQFIIPFLLLVGLGVGLFKRFSPAKLVALVGTLVLVYISLTSFRLGPDSVNWTSEAEASGFWTRSTIRMFLSGAGLLLFAIGFAGDNLCEVHRREDTEPSPGAYSSKAANGLTGNAQE